MRRISIALICVAAAAVLASSAWARTVHYEGKVEAHRGDVTFDVIKRHGRPKRVKNVAFDELKLHCEDDTNTSLSSVISGSGKVSRSGHFVVKETDRRFKGVLEDGGHAHGKITVHYSHFIHGACVNKQHDWAAKSA
jgi:hypothetical protein